jgi:hypothetical protein
VKFGGELRKLKKGPCSLPESGVPDLEQFALFGKNYPKFD